MSELESPRDASLDAFLADAVLGVERELSEDAAAPDLVAVLELARRMDAGAVPDGWVEEASQLTPVIDLREGRRLRRMHDDPEMDQIVGDVRAALEHEIGVELAGRAAVSAGSNAGAETPAPASRRSWALGLAAAALLVLGGASLLTAQLAERAEDTRPLAAISEHESASPEGALELREAGVRADAESQRETIDEESESDEAGDAPDVEDADSTDDAPVATPADRERAPAQASRAPLPDRLAALDAEAHAAWKAGDLVLARAKFEKIVAIGGRHRLADLAYGDLFTIARTLNEDRREAELWRAYLRRFPRGRFADDARAGLCRRAMGSEHARCWERYLRDMPNGAYRMQAERALTREGEER
jgi:hypothetical protein